MGSIRLKQKYMIHCIYIYFIINAGMTGYFIADDWHNDNVELSPLVFFFGLPYVIAVFLFEILKLLIITIGIRSRLDWLYVYYFTNDWKNKKTYIGNTRMIERFRKYKNPISKYYSLKIIKWHQENRHKK